MSYPNSLDVFTNKINNFDEVMAEDVNELQNSIMASQAFFGTRIHMGWLPRPDGKRVSATSFTVEGNHTALLKIGAKFRCTNGGATKYGYVLSSSYSAGTGRTTVKLVPNDSYSLAAGTLTQVYVSYANPPDFPAWFDYFATSTITGWSSPTGGLRFKMVGNQVFVDFHISGTSNATIARFTLPVPHAAGWHTRMGIIAQNNGTQIQGYMQMPQNASQVEFYTTIGYGGWADSGTKAVAGQFFYEGK